MAIMYAFNSIKTPENSKDQKRISEREVEIFFWKNLSVLIHFSSSSIQWNFADCVFLYIVVRCLAVF